MSDLVHQRGIGTLLRHLLELVEGDIAATYREAGLTEYRPRFSPYVRVLVETGPASIRDLAEAVGVTHSAASQTVAQMERCGFVKLQPGRDARQRIVYLSEKTLSVLPLVEAEWESTQKAMDELDAELTAPLSVVLVEALAALDRRPLRLRIADSHAPHASRSQEIR